MAGFMIKYGEMEHLQQIVDGSLRFAPSQTYVKLEESQHNKGQGDLLEGKMKIKFESAKMYHPETNEFLGTIPKSTVTVSIQDVSNMPIFCLSNYSENSVIEIEGKRYTNIGKSSIYGMKKDFPKATHALIICEPEKFIDDVHNISGHTIVSDRIHYYDYEINTIQMFMYLTTGEAEVKTGESLSMTYENRYRHLLCKDIAFAIQDEYRFVGLDELISASVFYPFNFKSKYRLVEIDELFGNVEM